MHFKCGVQSTLTSVYMLPSFHQCMQYFHCHKYSLVPLPSQSILILLTFLCFLVLYIEFIWSHIPMSSTKLPNALKFCLNLSLCNLCNKDNSNGWLPLKTHSHFPSLSYVLGYWSNLFLFYIL